MYKVILKKQAEKFLDKIDKNSFVRITNAILDLSYFPYRGDIKKLTGKYQGMFRLRIGDIIVLFVKDDRNKTVIIYLIDNRGDIY
ncbi:plasmid stabilization protein [candidate division WWE3 bacterium CG08_land_8_20_14_0_20_40_13]|uniref:Plasmid stabilization protein n=1 Tax=candidate division WWE3 bacterium CG08_land_8_20_14_0_20_40_13 TaxID=1975084 RepID=A0A2H0XEF9_UNCKA|nr:MAG: plasmid stabilization protein [candidate division WWE3 bacterium CG08_land_8_20_14_0_20_40_13]